MQSRQRARVARAEAESRLAARAAREAQACVLEAERAAMQIQARVRGKKGRKDAGALLREAKAAEVAAEVARVAAAEAEAARAEAEAEDYVRSRRFSNRKHVYTYIQRH